MLKASVPDEIFSGGDAGSGFGTPVALSPSPEEDTHEIDLHLLVLPQFTTKGHVAVLP